MTREEINQKIQSNLEKIKELRKDNIELYKQDVLLCDDKQQYYEEDREIVMSKGSKKTIKRRFGYIKWNETFKDEHTNKDVIIERNKPVVYDGVWLIDGEEKK